MRAKSSGNVKRRGRGKTVVKLPEGMTFEDAVRKVLEAGPMPQEKKKAAPRRLVPQKKGRS